MKCLFGQSKGGNIILFDLPILCPFETLVVIHRVCRLSRRKAQLKDDDEESDFSASDIVFLEFILKFLRVKDPGNKYAGDVLPALDSAIVS